jgi:hypothetical protein
MVSARRLLATARAFSRPSHVAVVLRDLAGRQHPCHADATHLAAAVAWLGRAQDATGCGGVSAGYHAADGGWLPPYPETTGYIISTFVRYGDLTEDTTLVGRAVRMAEWELDIQLPSGAVRGGIGVNDYPDVFNTGQVIDGWCALFRKTGDPRLLSAAMRAGRWLAKVQAPDGSWTAHSYRGIAHAYHARVAWRLLELARLAADHDLLEAGRRNVNWILSGAADNGWIDRMEFKAGMRPLTHTIVYTLEGLLGCVPFLEADLAGRALATVRAAAEHLLLFYERRKRSPDREPLPLPATFGPSWRSDDRYSCLTGNAQLAIVWLRLYEHEGDARYLNAALKILDHIKSTQHLTSANPGIRGGVAGSYPCWGAYFPLAFPNWAAKFFADALMRQAGIMQKLECA